MARRRKTKSRRPKKKLGVFQGIKNTVVSVGGFVVYIFPFVLFVAITIAAGFGIKESLYADNSIVLQRFNVVPRGGIQDEVLLELESRYLGERLLDVDLGKISKTVEKSHYIQRAEVIRQFPNELEIRVIQREPFAYLIYRENNKVGLISEDGVVVDLVDAHQSDMPLIHYQSAITAHPKAGSHFKYPSYASLVDFLKTFRDHKLSEKVTLEKVMIDGSDQMTVVYQEGARIKLGRSIHDTNDLLKKLSYLFSKEAVESIDYIDLRYEKAIVKKK